MFFFYRVVSDNYRHGCSLCWFKHSSRWTFLFKKVYYFANCLYGVLIKSYLKSFNFTLNKFEKFLCSGSISPNICFAASNIAIDFVDDC